MTSFEQVKSFLKGFERLNQFSVGDFVWNEKDSKRFIHWMSWKIFHQETCLGRQVAVGDKKQECGLDETM